MLIACILIPIACFICLSTVILWCLRCSIVWQILKLLHLLQDTLCRLKGPMSMFSLSYVTFVYLKMHSSATWGSTNVSLHNSINCT